MVDNLAFHQVAGDESGELLLQRHAPLVRSIALHLLGRLPRSVQVDDLIQAGMIGLLEASRNFRPEYGTSFEAFAPIRIRGAMLDELRRNDWVPRSVQRKSRQVAGAIREVEGRCGRDARPAEVAEVLGIDLDAYHQLIQDVSGSRLLSYDELVCGGEERFCELGVAESEAAVGLRRLELQQLLAGAIAILTERERMVLALYYDEELNLREVGVVLGVSESRVCQLHGQALLRLRGALEESLYR